MTQTYRILLADYNDRDFLKIIIAREGFPIELKSLPDCLEVITWIKDYNPENFLEAYWGEDIFRPMRETRQDFASVMGSLYPDPVMKFHEILRGESWIYNSRLEMVCVSSRTNWLEVKIEPTEYINLMKLPEIDIIKKVIGK